jgi:hypothetical protein
MVTLMVTLVGNITYFIHKQRRPRPTQGGRADDDNAKTNVPSRGYEADIQSK